MVALAADNLAIKTHLEMLEANACVYMQAVFLAKPLWRELILDITLIILLLVAIMKAAKYFVLIIVSRLSYNLLIQNIV